MLIQKCKSKPNQLPRASLSFFWLLTSICLSCGITIQDPDGTVLSKKPNTKGSSMEIAIVSTMATSREMAFERDVGNELDLPNVGSTSGGIKSIGGILPTGKAFVDAPGAGSIRTSGHGLRTDNPTPSASKSSSNGQFVTSQVTWPTLIPARSSFYESTSSPVEAAETSAFTYIVPSHGFLPMKAPSMKTPASLAATSSALKSWDREKKDPTWLSASSFSSLPLSEGDQGSGGGGAGAFSIFSTASPSDGNSRAGTPAASDRFGQVFKKPSNMNLLRKLWSSTRTAKLNLTHEHQSILRIESKPSSTDREDDVQIATSSSPSSQTSAPGSTKDAVGLEVAVPKPDRETKQNSDEMVQTLESPSKINPPTKMNPPSKMALGSLLQPPITSKPSLGQNIQLPLKFQVANSSSTIFQLSSGSIHITSKEMSDYSDHMEAFPKRAAASSAATMQTTFITGGSNKKPKLKASAQRLRNSMLYPEWLSSGGVYPDDNNNFTGDYYADQTEYDNSAEGVGFTNLAELEEEQPQRRNLFRKRINDEILAKVVNRTTSRVRDGARENLFTYNNIASSSNEADIGLVSAPVSNSGNIIDTESSFENTPGTSSLPGSQSGLADVISRGRIDSVMYVYFGDKFNDYHKEEVAGRIIQAVGGVVAAIAQVLTVLGAAKCVRRVTNSNSLPVHLHIGFALLLSNLLLLLAVHATEPADVCASVALILHYLHLVIGCWLFAHTLQTYRALCRHVAAPNLLSPDSEQDSTVESFRMVKPSTIRYSIAAWTAPVPFLIMSYVINPNGYETHRYCWMSIEKGMLISFILPVFLLIGLNTFLVVLSLRHLLALRKLWEDTAGEVDEDFLDGKIISKGIRASAMLLPLLAIMWFLGVVALENSTSIFFQLAATVASIVLSWLVMYFLGEDVWPETWCYCAKLDTNRRDSSIFEDPNGSTPSVQPSAQLSFDNEPLLAAAAPVPSTSSAVTSSATAMAGSGNGSSHLSDPGGYQEGLSSGGGKHHPTPPHPSTSSSSSRWPKSNKPNWSQPGGNEIYELRHDAISTIYK